MSRKQAILLAILLLLPVIAVLLHHYISHVPGLKPTGFIIDENVLYMSYAHQYLDQDSFSFFYSNPFDGDPGSAKIYFQPATWLFAVLLSTGADPGLCLSLFGLIIAFACIYTGILIIKHLLPGYRYQGFVALLFTWGGGLTAVAGLVAQHFVAGTAGSEWIDGIYIADPAQGWWGLNWGRTLFIPLEAFYHFLFLLNIYSVLKQKWAAAITLALILSASHPFTGIEYLLIMICWLFVEKIINRKAGAPNWFLGALMLITALHCWYYLFYLNGFPEHQVIFNQYSRAWTYSLRVALPAYILVFTLSIITVIRYRPVREFLSLPQHRLFLCWIIVAFLLSKHEWFIRPMQPIHFTRGYVWAGLFLFALPGIAWLINSGFIRKGAKLLLIPAILIFLSDNIIWIGNHLRGKATAEWEGHVSNDTRALIDFLKNDSHSNDLIVGNARLAGYLANVYSHANTWISHPFNTPLIENRTAIENEFLRSAIIPDLWRQRRVLIIVDRDKPIEINSKLREKKIFENRRYEIFTP